MTSPMSEFPRTMRLHEIGAPLRHEALVATPAECAALARRFDLLSLDAFSANLEVQRIAGAIRVRGNFTARGVQPCAISAEPVPFGIDEAIEVSFRDGTLVGDAEIELSEADLDELPVDGDVLDLGELAAQCLGLGLDPYPRAPEAVRAAAAAFLITEAQVQARTAADKVAANPFAALKR